MRLGKCLCAVEVDVADYGQHANIGLPVEHVGLFAVLERHVGHGGLGGKLPAWVVFTKSFGVKNSALNGCSIVFLALKSRDCALLDLIKPGLREGWALGYFCAEGKKVLGVLAQTACTYSGSGRTQTSADKVHLFVKGLFAVGLGAFVEQLTEQADGSRFFTLEHLAHVHGEAQAQAR